MRAGVPVTYQVLQADFAPELWREWIDRGVAANRRGAWLVPQVAGKPTSLMVGFQSDHPPLRPPPGLPGDRRTCRWPSGWPGCARPRCAPPSSPRSRSPGGFVQLLRANLHKLFPLGDPPDYEPPPERSVTALAAAQGRTTDEVLYDLMLQRDGQGAPLPAAARLRRRATSTPCARCLLHPATVLGLGDGGAHCGVLCDASLPTFMLAHWARDRSRGERLPVETVVHLQTRRTAELYGFRDRGLLAPGYLADVNVIDHDALAPRAARDGLRPPGVGQAARAAGPRLRGHGQVGRGGARARRGDGGAARPPPARPPARDPPEPARRRLAGVRRQRRRRRRARASAKPAHAAATVMRSPSVSKTSRTERSAPPRWTSMSTVTVVPSTCSGPGIGAEVLEGEGVLACSSARMSSCPRRTSPSTSKVASGAKSLRSSSGSCAVTAVK